MNYILSVAIIIIVVIFGYIYYDKRKELIKYEKVIVSYSEKVGTSIVDHPKLYTGIMNKKEDIFKIIKLGIMLPNPPEYVFVPTRNGTRKINIIKIDNDRFGFRIPKLSNQIYIQKRDENDNPIYNKNNNPVLIKHKWAYCDDIVEPDVKHWDENITEKMRIKHRTRADNLNKWIGAIVLGVILLGGIVVIHQTTKFVNEQYKLINTLSKDTAIKVEENAGMIGNLIKKLEEKTPKEP